MIESKSALLAVWLGLLVFGCGAPFLLSIPGANVSAPARIAPSVLRWALLAIAAALLSLRGVSGVAAPLVLSLAFLAPLLGGGSELVLGALAALPLLATTTWWAPGTSLTFPSALVFVLAGICAAALTRLPLAKQEASARVTLALLFVVAVIAIQPMGQLGTPLGFWMAWHHWGAYVAPAQAMLGGGVPYRDFPVQYGMGPTLLIAALSGGDPWSGTYRAASLVNALYLPVVGACVGLALRAAPRGQRLLALAAVVCAILFWSGFPPDELGMMATPSVGGMRFLPLALLMSSILASEASGRSGTVPGYACWLLGMAWSPEAAVYATIVWFPYLGLRAAQARDTNGLRDVILAALRGAAVAVAALTAGAAVLAVLFRAAFGEWPSIYGFLVYILNPPGILPANPLGPIWLALATLAIGAVGLVGADPRSLRTGMVCILGFTAVLSYYLLGRSHDNNVLNLFPFLALAAASALSGRLKPLFVGFLQVALVGMVAWPATFGFGAWSAAVASGEALSVGPARFLERVRFASPDAWALLNAHLDRDRNAPHAPSADAGAALSWLAERGERPVVVSRAMILPRYSAGSEWTGVNDMANFDLLPRDVVAHFIRNGATHFHRPGWLLVDRANPTDWPQLFAAAYDLSEERVFGGYTAYRFTPK